LTDIPGDLSTTASVTVGSVTSGNLELVGDHDWYKISLSAGQAITVTLNGITLDDPYLNIRDSSGNIIFSNDDITLGTNRNSQVSFSASYSGTYYIDAGAYQDGSAGTYQISVQTYSPPPLATNDQIANELTSGYWDGDVHHWAVTQGGTITVNISTLNASEQNLARAALQEWTDIIGVHFQEVASGGQIQFDDSEDSSGPIAATDANWSSGIISSAHVHISTSWVNKYGIGLYSYSFQTYVHEIGHALGLGHSGNYNDTATYPYDALFQNDAWSTSIMSYFDQHDNTYFGGQGFTVNYAVTPMQADIVAMQSLYGLSTTTRTGDTTYGYNSNAGGIYSASTYPKAALTIFDSGGNDTLDYSGTASTQRINLNPETFSNVNGYVGNLSIGRGVVIENAVGGAGADTIIGNSVNNVLKGNLGSDTLTGSSGSDTFLDTKAGHNGDTITDFSSGDTIVFSDATLSGFTFTLSGHTLTYGGGSLTLTNIPSGSIIASAAAGGGVQLALASSTTPPSAHVRNDFNGDGRSDILLRHDDGRVTDWLGTSAGAFSSNSANLLTGVSTDWQIAGTGDFNGDGRDDVMWRNVDGRITNWLGTASGGFADNVANAYNNVSTDWHVAGIGDFNGDGRDDILWRNNDGRVTDWMSTASGGYAPNSGNFNTSISSDWQIVGTGDFNGDGRDDIMWRNVDGRITNWLGTASGSFADNVANAYNSVSTDWHVAGIGDFNGDARDDILWHNNDGRVTDWMSTASGGYAPNSGNFYTGISTDWQVASVGDFNGDGRDDILWRNTDGHITDWLGTITGGFSDNVANAYNSIDTHWHVQPVSLL
jgi:hypothetical protein